MGQQFKETSSPAEIRLYCSLPVISLTGLHFVICSMHGVVHSASIGPGSEQVCKIEVWLTNSKTTCYVLKTAERGSQALPLFLDCSLLLWPPKGPSPRHPCRAPLYKVLGT